MESLSDNKRLAKNTMMLYIRTFIMMIIGFFTSRLILNTLGIENYGINNVVAGFIAMFSVVQTTLTNSTTRFMSFELGKGRDSNPKKIFGIAMTIHIGLALFMVLILETVGLYFLNHGLNIPEARMGAANWVFHFAVISMAVGIINSPYTGLIIAHERMGAFAYMSFLDVTLKLIIVYLLYITPFDRLITYSAFYLFTNVIVIAIYYLYARRKFPEAKYQFVREKESYEVIFKFAGYNFLGGIASMLSTQGTNILVNLFFGVTLNAAIGIASQVQGLSTKFVGDFITALKPQITKEYAAGHIERSMLLAFRGSKFAFFLTLILAVPLIIRTPYILTFWLKIYPQQAIIFSRLVIILTMLVLLSDTLVTEMLASGKVAAFNLWVGTLRLLIIPLEYIVLSLFHFAYLVVVVQIFMEIISLVVRLICLQNVTGKEHVVPFMRKVLLPTFIVTFISVFFALLFNVFIADNFLGLCVFSGLSIIVCLSAIYLVGLSSTERYTVTCAIQKKFNNLFGAKRM